MVRAFHPGYIHKIFACNCRPCPLHIGTTIQQQVVLIYPVLRGFDIYPTPRVRMCHCTLAKLALSVRSVTSSPLSLDLLLQHLLLTALGVRFAVVEVMEVGVADCQSCIL
jgi:hypothetical protein